MVVKLYDKIALNQGLVLDLPLFEGVGALARDISKPHNNGTIATATWVAEMLSYFLQTKGGYGL